MNRLNLSVQLVFLVATTLASIPTYALDEWPQARYRVGSSRSHDNCCWNCDDYCRKPFPAAPCPAPGCYPDCYVRKPFPCAPCVSGCASANDYIRKCFPRPPYQCLTPGLPRGI